MPSNQNSDFYLNHLAERCFKVEKQEINSFDELNKIAQILFKHIKLIIVTIILTVVVSAVGVFLVIKPKYQSSSEIIVNQKLDKDAQVSEQQQVQATDLQLVNTYKSILNSQTIGNAVRNKVGKSNYSDSSLNVTTDTSSQVININVTSHNSSNAARIANVTANVFKSKIKKIMNVNNVSIISNAQKSKKPISPKKGLTLIIGAALGLVLGSFLALFKEHTEKTITSQEYIEKELGLINLGTISDIDMKSISKQIKK